MFGADGKPVFLSRIFTYFDNKHMESKAKLFLIQVSSKTTTHTVKHFSYYLPQLNIFYFSLLLPCLVNMTE